MLFNSIDFLVFLVLIAAGYRFLYQHVGPRNLYLLLASYLFYGWCDYRFLLLLIFSTAVDYAVALALTSSEGLARRRCLLALSMASNLGVLAYFKYANFFVESASQVLQQLGMQASFPTLQIVLPVGISFYTFQTLSYTIDVYRRQLAPTRNFVTFALYVAFFPQLVAGPIERAKRLLPQLSAPVRYARSNISIGCWLLLFGYFKKVFVADNIGASIDPIFANAAGHSAVQIWLAVLGFSAQIYGDFSGYSDIARGISRLLGFQLMVNFRCPYFAAGPSEFWRRWHISLSTWLRDYLYIPLGGNRCDGARNNFNLLTTMLIGGLWHGASMKFIAWGGYHGLLLVVERSWRAKMPHFFQAKQLLFLRVGVMFCLTQVGWLIFRAPSLETAWAMFCNVDFSWTGDATRLLLKILFYAGPLALLDAWMEFSGDLLVALKQSISRQCVLFAAILLLIVVMGFHGRSEFIYFQF